VCALVGIGGAGKTAIVERFLDELLNCSETDTKRLGGNTPVFVYSFYDDDIPENFFRHLQFWLDGTSTPTQQKSPTQLIFDIQQRAGLMILDGLEKVQECGARGNFGRLASANLRELLNHVSSGSAGKLSIVVTSRFPLTDLRDSQARYFNTIAVDKIDVAAGVALLRQRGVHGTDQQLVLVVENCGRHALTIDLAGGYIKEYGNCDPNTPLNLGTAEELLGECELELDDDKRAIQMQGIRFARIAQRYREAMLDADEAALALLERICLFRLGVDCETLSAIFTGSSAERVSGKALANLDFKDLQRKLNWLARLGIVEQHKSSTPTKQHSIRYTVHPAIQDGFLSLIARDDVRLNHVVIRKSLELSLGQAPGVYPSDHATLDLIEEIIHHALETGETSVAWNFYQNRLGGCQNLLARLNDFSRASRVTNAILKRQSIDNGLPTEITTILRSDHGYSCVELGDLASAMESLLIGMDQCLKTNDHNLKTLSTNLACAFSESGRLKQAIETLETAMARIRDPNVIQQALLHIAQIATLRGTVHVVVSAEDVRRHIKIAESAVSKRIATETVRHSSMDVHRRVNELESQLDELNREARLAELADVRLELSECYLLIGDIESANACVTAAHEWAVVRESRRILSNCSLLRSKILQVALSSKAISNSCELLHKLENSIEYGIRIARDCGYGLCYIDILLERARFHLLQGNANAALEDVEVAMETGVAADPAKGQVELLAANHKDCGYAWAIPRGLQLRGEAYLLLASQKLDQPFFAPGSRSDLPTGVQHLLDNAESCLTQSLHHWELLRDPNPEFNKNNVRLDGREYHWQAVQTFNVLTELGNGILPRKSIIAKKLTQNEKKFMDIIVDPKLRSDALWLALDRAIRSVVEDNRVLTDKKPDWEFGLNSANINKLASDAELSERPVFEVPQPIIQGGVETDRFLIIHHPDMDEPLEICTWRRFGNANISPPKVTRLLVYLQAWQSKRVNQLTQESVSTPHKPVDREKVTIGIITALPKEFVAVKLLLSNTQEIHVNGQGAGRRYVVGSISSSNGNCHWVALALADMGNNIASVYATLLVQNFPVVESILMVGIAGGVPNPTKPEDHVRLGDIVVSNKKGVIQYDMVKLQEVRCCPITPSAKLIEAVRFLEAQELQRQRPWDSKIEFILNELKHDRPDAATDKLFDSNTPSKQVTHPADLRRLLNQPRVFLGPVASANELLKDPIKRDSLRDAFGVKAVEMEGSGIADATWMCELGYLVVRGICDYCDSHKNDVWQEYAAASAAAYAVALIESLPSQP
jgi:nucleoside phosphorylase/tetratricopeptide (TPR) repeat protein